MKWEDVKETLIEIVKLPFMPFIFERKIFYLVTAQHRNKRYNRTFEFDTPEERRIFIQDHLKKNKHIKKLILFER